LTISGSETAVRPVDALPAATPPAARPWRQWTKRHWLPLRDLARTHRWLTALLAAAVLLRMAVYAAYRPAFWFNDSESYLAGAKKVVPLVDRPFGYSAFLKPFLVSVHVAPVTLAQHLSGLALLVGGYAFLVRRGLSRWAAALAVAPVALDARQVALEHFILSETVFTAALFAGVIMLVSAPDAGRLPVRTAALAGGIFAYAALTRTVGIPLGVLAVGYLLVRRAGWQAVLSFVGALAIPLAAYTVWYHSEHGVYGFGQYQGRILYARTLTFADCTKLDLAPRERMLCPDEPLDARAQRTDIYVWTLRSPGKRQYPDVKDDPVLGDWASKAIRQQPGDYARTVLRETGWHLLPWPPLDAESRCLVRAWQLPVIRADTCQTLVYARTPLGSRPRTHGLYPDSRARPVREVLHEYSHLASTPGIALSACLVLIAGVGLRRAWQRRPAFARTDAAARVRADADAGRRALDGLFLGAVGLALIVISVATVMFDSRYSVPSVLFIPIGAALAAARRRERVAASGR
jgi:hypothetical protein